MRPLLTLLLLAAALPGACAKTPSAPPPGLRTDVPIENFAEVASGVFRGAQPDEKGFAALKALGVKTVVNLRARHDDAKLAAAHGIEVLTIPMKAALDIDPPDDAEIRAFLDTVTDPAKRPVFFHCAHGKDRTGTMCAIFRMEVEGWDAERAYEEMKAFGWHDEIYAELGAFVRAYEPHVLAADAPPK